MDAPETDLPDPTDDDRRIEDRGVFLAARRLPLLPRHLRVAIAVAINDVATLVEALEAALEGDQRRARRLADRLDLDDVIAAAPGVGPSPTEAEVMALREEVARRRLEALCAPSRDRILEAARRRHPTIPVSDEARDAIAAYVPGSITAAAAAALAPLCRCESRDYGGAGFCRTCGGRIPEAETCRCDVPDPESSMMEGRCGRCGLRLATVADAAPSAADNRRLCPTHGIPLKLDEPDPYCESCEAGLPPDPGPFRPRLSRSPLPPEDSES